MSSSRPNSEQCWFCRRGLAESGAAAEVKMHKLIDDSGAAFKTLYAGWDSSSVHVPRCSRCKSAHDRTEGHISKGWKAGLLVGLLLAVLYLIFFRRILLIPVIVFGTAIAGGLVGWAVSRAFSAEGVRDQGYGNEHPEVKGKEAEGWEIGERPIVDESHR